VSFKITVFKLDLALVGNLDKNKNLFVWISNTIFRKNTTFTTLVIEEIHCLECVYHLSNRTNTMICETECLESIFYARKGSAHKA